MRMKVVSQVLLKGEREVKRHVVRKILGVRKVKSPQQKRDKEGIFQWKSPKETCEDINIHIKYLENPGLKRLSNLTNITDYFMLFFTQQLLAETVAQTNLYANTERCQFLYCKSE